MPEKRKTPRSSPVHPNAGITVAYRKRIQTLVDEMARSFQHWMRAAYRADPPVMATDAIPAKELQDAVEELARRWRRRFDDAAPELARWFATKASRRSDAALRAILKRGGFTVKYRMTRAMRDVFAATVEQNVALIRNIPETYITQVQGSVMRSVQTGRDLGQLTRDLVRQHGVTRRRAAFIALDQNNKCTSALMKVRQLDLGIEKGIWVHSHAGKEPRPTHVKNSGETFNIATGWFDPDPKVRAFIMPGQLPPVPMRLEAGHQGVFVMIANDAWPLTPDSMRLDAELLDGTVVKISEIKPGDIFRAKRVLTGTYHDVFTFAIDDQNYNLALDEPMPSGLQGYGYAVEVATGPLDAIKREKARG